MSARRLIGALLLITALSCGGEQPTPPGVVLIILDTTRADHLSAFGYERETTPNFKRLADEGERYTNAWSHSPWTLPSIASILTGQPPHRHGAGRGADGMFGIRTTTPTIAERLQANGWQTAAMMNVRATPAMSTTRSAGESIWVR